LTQQQIFFDGHNDVLTRLIDRTVDDAVSAFVNGEAHGHIDLPRMLAGNLMGGMFALYVSSANADQLDFSKLKGGSFHVPLPPPLSVEAALPVVMRQAALLHRFVANSSGRMNLCCSATEVQQTINKGCVAAVMHMEGAEALDDELLNLDILYNLGPLIATHSNAHSLCQSTRNLSDDQLLAIKDSDGMVGVNLATAFLREDGQMRSDTSIDLVLRHMDYLINILGEDRVGLGSDFDGAVVPAAIKSAADVNLLSKAMELHGYTPEPIDKLCNRNWLNALQRTWGQ